MVFWINAAEKCLGSNMKYPCFKTCKEACSVSYPVGCILWSKVQKKRHIFYDGWLVIGTPDICLPFADPINAPLCGDDAAITTAMPTRLVSVMI